MELNIKADLFNNKQNNVMKEMNNEIETINNNNYKNKDISFFPNVTIDINSILIINSNEIVLIGKLLSHMNLILSTLEYESYLNINKLCYVYVFNVSTIKLILNELNILKQNSLYSFKYTINLNTCFIYHPDKEDNKYAIEFSIALKSYILFFNKFKYKENMLVNIDSNGNQSEKIILQELFIFLKSTIYDNSKPQKSCVDLYLCLCNESNQENTLNKREFLSLLASNSICVLLNSNNKNLQLDSPEIEFLFENNITFSFVSIESYFSNNVNLSLLVNFIKDFMIKIQISSFDSEQISDKLTIVDLSRITKRIIKFRDEEYKIDDIINNENYIIIEIK